MPDNNRISTCLWFNDQAQEAASFYTAIFPNSAILQVIHDSEAGRDIHRREPGSVMLVEFELDGHRYTALNGGPAFRFNQATSLVVNCANQEEIDHYWHRLCDGGDPAAQQCGWLKDKYGISWQVVPARILDLFQADTDPELTARCMAKMMKMKKIRIDDLT